MKRLFDWRTRLHSELANWRERNFVWGESDCVSFVNSCVLAMTDTDVLSGLSPQAYRDEHEAVATITALHFESISTALGSLFEEVQSLSAHEGDIAVLDGDETGEGLGIILGERVAVLSLKGYATVARKRIQRAFHIP